MVFCLVASRAIERLLTPAVKESWLSPLLAAGFGLYVLVRLFEDPAKLSDRKGAP
jgi:hypothetical protein